MARRIHIESMPAKIRDCRPELTKFAISTRGTRTDALPLWLRGATVSEQIDVSVTVARANTHRRWHRLIYVHTHASSPNGYREFFAR
jgi:hypothetical protein